MRYWSFNKWSNELIVASAETSASAVIDGRFFWKHDNDDSVDDIWSQAVR